VTKIKAKRKNNPYQQNYIHETNFTSVVDIAWPVYTGAGVQ